MRERKKKLGKVRGWESSSYYDDDFRGEAGEISCVSLGERKGE